MSVHTTTSLDGKVLEITLDRPKANAIDAATSREMSNAFVAFMADPVQRVAILTVERHFTQRTRTLAAQLRK